MDNEVLLLKQLMKENKMEDVVQMLEKGGKIVKKIIKKKKKKGKRKFRDGKPMRIYGPPTRPAPVFGMGPPGPSGIISQGPTAQQIEGSIKRAQEEERRRYDDELDKYKKLHESNDEITKIGQDMQDKQEEYVIEIKENQENIVNEINDIIKKIGNSLLLQRQQPVIMFDTQGYQAPTTFQQFVAPNETIFTPIVQPYKEPSNNFVEEVERVVPQDVRGMGFELEYNPEEEEEVEKVVEQERQEIPQEVIEEVEQLLGKIDIQPQDLDIQQGKPDATTSEFLFNKPLNGQILGESSAMGQQYKMEDFDTQKAEVEAKKGKQAIASEELRELFSEDKFPGAIGMNNKINNKLKLLYNRTTGYDLPTTKTAAVKALKSMIDDNGITKLSQIYNEFGKRKIYKKNI